MLIKKHPAWKLASIIVMTGSFTWALLLLQEGFTQLIHQGISTEPYMMIASWFLGLLSIFISSGVFYQTMLACGAKFSSFREACELNFTAQLMKNIPGRFFGVAYQALKAKHVANTQTWILGNIATTILSTWLGLLFALSSLCFVLDEKNQLINLAFATILILPIVLALTYKTTLRNHMFRDWITKASRKIKITLISSTPLHFKKALIWGLLGWAVYASAWLALGEGISQITPRDGLHLGALYTLAWAVGYFTLITPAGIGVREMAFSMMSSSFPPDVVAFVAIIMRVALLSFDIVLASIFIHAKK